MRNRAKCKLCGDIIESLYRNDYVDCKCGEIGVGGGNDYFRAKFNDKENFLCIDDEGNEIIPTERKGEPDAKEILETIRVKPTKKELLQMLDEMIKRIESLPVDALYAPVTHADFVSLILLLSSILRSD